MISAGKRSVMLAGYYGYQNTGDDSFEFIGEWGARHYWQAERVVALKASLFGTSRPERAAFEDRSAGDLVGRSEIRGKALLKRALALTSTPLLVWSGGSLFQSRVSLWRSLAAVSPYIVGFGTGSVGGIGVSLGPYESVSDQMSVHRLLRRFRFLAVRDERSWMEARALELPYDPVLASDLAWLLPEACGEDSKSVQFDVEGRVLGVSICHYERYVAGDLSRESQREAVLAAALERLSSWFEGTIRLFVMNGDPRMGDREVTERLRGRLSGKRAAVEMIDYHPDPVWVWRRIRECTAFISFRLHGGIFAAAARVPCLWVEYHRKVVDLLDDLRAPARWRVGDLDGDAGCLERKLAELLHTSGEEVAHMLPSRDRLIARARLNFTGLTIP